MSHMRAGPAPALFFVQCGMEEGLDGDERHALERRMQPTAIRWSKRDDPNFQKPSLLPLRICLCDGEASELTLRWPSRPI
jgi:hypothetical protein